MSFSNLLDKKNDLNFKKLFGVEDNNIICFIENNIPVNNDLNELFKSLGNKDYRNIFVIINSVLNKNRIFYKPSDYELFEKFRKSFMCIKQFLSKHIGKSELKFVNDKFLSLELISDKCESINLECDNSIYRFTVNELINIYKYSLHKISESFYSSKNMEPPKNPWTNLPFSLKNNLIIYDSILKYYISRGRSIPVYILSFKECLFKIETFYLKNYSFLMNKSIKSFVDQLSYRHFLLEFFDMMESDDDLVVSYCSKCYQKINLKKIFSHTVQLFLLNSNGIFVFGDYKKEFIITAKAFNIFFDKEHAKQHTNRRRRLTYSRSSRTRRNNINSPIYLSNFNSTNIPNFTNNQFHNQEITIGQRYQETISNDIVNSTDENNELEHDSIIGNNTVNSNIRNSSSLTELNTGLSNQIENLITLSDNYIDITNKFSFEKIINLGKNLLIYIHDSSSKSIEILTNVKKMSEYIIVVCIDIKNFIPEKSIIKKDIIIEDFKDPLIFFHKTTPTIHMEEFESKINIENLKNYINVNYASEKINNFLPNDRVLKNILFSKVLEVTDKDYWKIITTTRINGQLVNALVYFYSSKSISKEKFNKDLQVLKTIARNIADTLIEKNILMLTLNVDDFEYLDTDYEYTFNLHEKCMKNPNVYYLKSDQNSSKYTFSECNLDIKDTKLIEYVSEL